MTRFCKTKDHNHLDNCNILEKYAGTEIGYILETRPDPGKCTVFFKSACKKGLKSVEKPFTFVKMF